MKDRQGILNVLVAACFILSYGGAWYLLSTTTEYDGNGGAFVSALSIALAVVGGVITSILGLACAFYGFLRLDTLPEGIMYSPWVPLALSTPPLLYVIWQYSINCC